MQPFGRNISGTGFEQIEDRIPVLFVATTRKMVLQSNMVQVSPGGSANLHSPESCANHLIADASLALSLRILRADKN